MDTKNLVQRYRTWYVRVVVPPALKAIVGKREITRSLQTSDLKEANRKKHRVLADIHETIARATTQTTLSKDDAAYVMELAKQAAQSVRDGERSQAEARDDLSGSG